MRRTYVALRVRVHCDGMVAPGRVELPTFGLGNRCSIHLSYGAVCLFASVYTLRRVFWLYKGCTCWIMSGSV